MNPEDIADSIRERLSPPTAEDLSEPAPSRSLPRIPDYQMLGRIGRGNYGDVWLARNITGGLRAIKVVWRREFSHDRPYEREFHGIVQFEPISRSHPGVVSILHVGRDDAAGCFYYVMELADDAAGLRVEKGAESRTGLSQSSTHAALNSYTPRTLASDIQSRGR